MSSTTEYQITERPITGEINTADVNTVAQITKEEFLALVDAVLDLPHVVALKWEQYTPYFNDGEPCVFSVGEGRIVLDSQPMDGGDYDDGSLATYDLYDSHWDLDSRSYGPKSFDLPQIGFNTQAHYEALSEFDKSARWERVALLSFGDHAEVTATKTGFSVEFYDHD